MMCIFRICCPRGVINDNNNSNVSRNTPKNRRLRASLGGELFQTLLLDQSKNSKNTGQGISECDLIQCIDGLVSNKRYAVYTHSKEFTLASTVA